MSSSLKKMIRKLLSELGEAVADVDLAQIKLRKAEHNAKTVFQKLKDSKVLPIADMEEAQFLLYLKTDMGFEGKGKLGSELSIETKADIIQFAAINQLPLVN